MSISYSQKVNERLIGQSIPAELHTIGIIGVDPTVVPGLIRLVEVPQAPSPLSTVFVTAVGPGGPYNEIFSGTPTGNNFLVDYTTGVITFDVSNDGKNISVAYIGLGSEISAEDVNQLQVPVGVALNYDGSLTNNIVKPASISNTITDNFTFPNNVIVSNEIKAADFLTASSSPATSGVIRLAATDAIKFGTSNYPLTTDGSGNLTWRGDIIATSTGDVTSITGTVNQIIASSATGNITLSTPQDIALSSSPTFVSETLTSTTNQLVLGTTRTVTITAPTPAVSSRTWTLPDLSTSPTFAALEGTQTFSGAKTFSNTLTSTATSGNTVIIDTNTFIVDATNHRVGIKNTTPSVELDVTGSVNVSLDVTVPTGTITQSETYSATGHSHQGVAGDETLGAAVGSNTPTDPKFIAAAMFNVHDNGSPLTSTANYLAGVIGADSITGAKATSYPKGAVLAQISDGVTASDGAVVAYVDGDSSVTLANAAFKAMQNNSQSGSGFTYGLDLFGAAHDGYLELSIKNAAIRMDHEVCILNASGAPTNGVTGATFAQIGSLYIDNFSGNVYANTGTKAVPVWTQFSSGGSGANTHLSNLSAVAVNTSLLPGSDDTIDLGNSSFRWRNLLLSETALVGGTSIAASAIVDLQSTTKGFLPPRMTNTQRDAISSPATGLIIYSTTDNQWEGWNGTSWVVLG